MAKERGGGRRPNATIRGFAAGRSAASTANAGRFLRGRGPQRANAGNFASIARNAETIAPGITARARARGVSRITGASIQRNAWLRNALVGQERNTAANRGRIANAATRSAGVQALSARGRGITGRGARARQFALGSRAGGGRGNPVRSFIALTRGSGTTRRRGRRG